MILTDWVRVTAHCRISAPNDPKMTLTTTMSIIISMSVASVIVSKHFNPFRFIVNRFRVTGHFEKIPPNDQMTLNVTM